MTEHPDLRTHSVEAARPYLSRHRSDAHRFSRERAALLVIDMQRYFLQGSSHAYLPEAEEIIGNVQEILAECRNSSMPVAFTRHAYSPSEDPGPMGRWWADVIRDGSEESLIDDRFAPRDSEKVMRKTTYSAFVGTDLEQWLHSRSISQILVTGVMTHLCCESTAREGFMRGFDIFLVVDGTASSDRELHLSSIRTLTDGFAMPVTTEEVLRWIRS